MTTARLKAQTQIDTTDIVYLWFMTITAVDGTVIRVVNDLKDWVGPGNETYTAFPFSVQLMADDGERVSSVKIQTINVSRDFIKVIRDTVAPPTVKIELALSDNPKVVEKSVDFLALAGVEYDALTMSFDLRASSVWGRKTSAATFNALEFPAIHYGVS